MSKTTARAVIRICDWMLGYHGKLVNQAIIGLAGSVVIMSAMIGLAVMTL